MINCKYLKEIDKRAFLTIKRSGIILITTVKKELHFVMGIDNKSKEISDFGGRVKDDEDCIDAAIREFKEEIKFIYPLHRKNIENYKALYTKHELIIFVPLEIKFKSLRNFFNNLKKTNKDEMIDLILLSKNDLINCLYDTYHLKMYDRVKNILKLLL